MGLRTAHIALREGFANSIIHAAYTQIGNVTVDRWKNRIVMSNPGTMLVSMEQFFQGQQSVCRNPLIQNMFVQLGVGEKAGSGADIIVKGWKDNGWTSPIVEELIRPDRVVLTLGLESSLKDNQPTSTDKKTSTNHQQTTNKPLTNHQQNILECLMNGEKSLLELMEICGYKDKRSFRQSILNDLLFNDIVSMTHPENVNHKKQRYVITDLGRSFLEQKQD